jgi:hypothetical protein
MRLPADVKAQMEADAAERDMTVSQLMRWLHRKWSEAGKPDSIAKAKK